MPLFQLLGTSCETKIDNCLGNDCKNGASCVSKQNGYSCNCIPGYSGQLCEIDIDECALNPCRHGQCRDGINKYMCDCYPGYTGTNCDVNIDDCQSRWVLFLHNWPLPWCWLFECSVQFLNTPLPLNLNEWTPSHRLTFIGGSSHRQPKAVL